MKIHNFFAELKRRNVYKVAITYVVAGWALAQAASILLPTFEAPAGVVKVGAPFPRLWTCHFGDDLLGIRSDAARSKANGECSAWCGPPNLEPTKVCHFRCCRRRNRGWSARLPPFLRPKSTLARLDPPPTSYGATGRAQAATGLIPQKSIAVLPFVNMSADKNDEYLSDGVSEELITALSKITGLQVKARTSSFAFKGQERRHPEDWRATARESFARRQRRQGRQ